MYVCEAKLWGNCVSIGAGTRKHVRGENESVLEKAWPYVSERASMCVCVCVSSSRIYTAIIPVYYQRSASALAISLAHFLNPVPHSWCLNVQSRSAPSYPNPPRQLFSAAPIKNPPTATQCYRKKGKCIMHNNTPVHKHLQTHI